MKKFLALLLPLIAIVSAKAQTADDVINKYLAAAGGKEKLESIHSLQYVQTMNLSTPLGEMQIVMTNIKVKNKLVRINTSSEMFGNAYSVVTDTSGWVIVPANQFTGGEAVREKLKPEERKALLSQMYCEGYFPELVNYAQKGYTAELAGEGKGNGRPSYKLKLKKEKGENTYFIDKETGLINAVIYKGAGAAAAVGLGNIGIGGKSDKAEFTVNLGEYKDVAGIKFPGKITLETPMGSMHSTIGFVTVNKAVDAKWYRAD